MKVHFLGACKFRCKEVEKVCKDCEKVYLIGKGDIASLGLGMTTHKAFSQTLA